MKVMESSANGGAKFRACFVGHAGNEENESNVLSPAFKKYNNFFQQEMETKMNIALNYV